MTLDPPAPLKHGNFFLNGYMIFWRSLHELKKQTMLADFRSDDSPTYASLHFYQQKDIDGGDCNILSHLSWI